MQAVVFLFFLEKQQMSVVLWRSLDNRKLTCRWSPAEGLVVKRLRSFKDSVKNPPPVTHLLFTFSWRLFHCCRAVWQQQGTRLDVDSTGLKPPFLRLSTSLTVSKRNWIYVHNAYISAWFPGTLSSHTAHTLRHASECVTEQRVDCFWASGHSRNEHCCNTQRYTA